MSRLVSGLALLSTGLLAGAFGYGAVNLVAGFNAVPLDVRLTFHAALMGINGQVMQTLMALAILSCAVLALRQHGRPRILAATASLLAVASLLITRFGNVPINAHIKLWAADGAVPDGYAELLHRWEQFNIARTATGLTAFVLVVLVAVSGAGRAAAARPPAPDTAG